MKVLIIKSCKSKKWDRQEEFEDTKRGNQNPYIEEEQTTQWSKEKVQKDKQRSTKHTHRTKDRVTRTPLKTGVNSDAPEVLYKYSSNCFKQFKLT